MKYSHTRTKSNGTNKLSYHGQNTNLRHGERSCSNRGSIRIGDIVGAISKGAHAERDRDQGDDPRILLKNSHDEVG